MEKIFFGIALAGYTAAMALYLSYAVTRKESLANFGRWLMIGAIVLHIVSLLARTHMGRMIPDHGTYTPWNNWFESFSFFSLVLALEFQIIQSRSHLPILGAFASPLIFMTMMMAVHSPAGSRIPALPPELQSHWMSIHIPVIFTAYAAFGNAFAVGLAYLIQERQLKSKHPTSMAFRLPPLEELDGLIFHVIVFALPVLTIGVLLGARWAHVAWGRYWGWDPKETWAFVTWLVYGIYIYMRLFVGWRGRKTVYLSLAGFAVVIFTYVGVNYLSALHGFLSSAL